MKHLLGKSMMISVFFVISFQGFLPAQTAKMVLIPYENEKLNKYGFKDSLSGKIVISPRYDYAGRFSDGLSKVQIDAKYGFVDKTGKLVLQCKYDYIYDISDGMAVLKTMEGKYGFCNNKGVVVIPPKYDDAGDFGSGLAPVKSGEKYGYINKAGQVVIGPKYDQATRFMDGLAVVTNNNLYALTDKTGKLVLPYRNHEISYFAKGVYKVRNDHLNTYGLISKTGTWLTDSTFRYIGDLNTQFEGGMANILDASDKMGFVNAKGEVIQKPAFDSWKKIGSPHLICVYTNYKLYVTENTRFGLYDLNQKKLITELIYNEIDDELADGLIAFVKDGKIGYLDTLGVEVVSAIFEKGFRFENGVATVGKDNKMMLVDKKGNVISKSYDLIFSYLADLYLVNNGGTWDEENGLEGGKSGIIRKDGTELLPPECDQIGTGNEGIFIFISDGILGMADRKGEQILLSSEITWLGEFHDGRALIRMTVEDPYYILPDEELWGYINKTGEVVIPVTYQDAFDFSGGLGQVKRNDTIIFLDTLGNEAFRLLDVENVGPFSDGMAWVLKEGKVGYIDKTGTLKIPCIYQNGKEFSDGVTIVELLDYEILINKKGEEIRRWKK